MSEETTVVEEVEAPKRDRKLKKSIEGSVVTIEAIGGELGEMSFDVNELPEKIQEAMIPFGISHKLGDAAAGRQGTDAEAAIKAVWDSLLKGEMTTRQPAAPKVSIKQVKDGLANMSPEDAAKARALMAQMGITL